MQQLVEGIFVERDLAPYNVGLIATSAGVLLVDLPLREQTRQRWIEDVQRCVGPVRAVVLTDTAPERLLAAAGCPWPLIASEVTLRRIDTLRADERVWSEFVWSFTRRFHLEPEAYLKRMPPRVSFATRTSMTLHWRHRPVQVETISGGPHPGGVWVWVTDARILFTGDALVLGEPPLFTPEQSWEAWEALVQEVSQRPVAHIVPGRGVTNAFSGDVEALREFLRVLRHAAQKLARSAQPSLGDIQRAVNDLHQGFFPHLEARSEAILRLRALLECLVMQYRNESCIETP